MSLTSLETLALVGNNIQKLPVQMLQLEKLQSLNFSMNSIDHEEYKLQNWGILSQLKSLQKLDLSYNAIYRIDNQFVEYNYFENLQVIDLSHNLIQTDMSIKSLLHLRNLKEIFIEGNEI